MRGVGFTHVARSPPRGSRSPAGACRRCPPQREGHDLFEFGEETRSAESSRASATVPPRRRAHRPTATASALLIRRAAAAAGCSLGRRPASTPPRHLDGVHRIAEFAQPVHVPAHGPGADAEAFGQLGAGPVAVHLEQGQQAQESRPRFRALMIRACPSSLGTNLSPGRLSYLEGMTKLTPFRIAIPEHRPSRILNRRLAATRWPDALPGVGWTLRHPDRRGRRELAEYWRTGFDWRAQEAAWNRYPQFVHRNIDRGQRMHFLHIRSAEADAGAAGPGAHGWPFEDFTAP